MKNLIKIFIKNILKRYDWRLVKMVVPREYRPFPPEKELVNEIIDSTGILHLGAHRGGEAPIYEYFAKSVIWVEANPKIFNALEENLYVYKKQRAFCALLGDEDGKLVDFNLSNNDSASSSIFELGKLITDSRLKMINKIKLKMTKLDTLLHQNNINANNFNHWVMDLQGAELLTLKGADKSIKSCRSIYIEISKGEVYKEAAQWEEVLKFLKENNFSPAWLPKSDHTDVLFIKKNNI